MNITHHILDTVQLPRGMVWVDEFDWSATETASQHSITGALLVDAATRLAGRPITLQADPDAGWIKREVLLQLQALADAPAATRTLVLADGRVFGVVFAPGQPITARPVARPELPKGTHPYVATVRLIQA